MGGSCLNTHYSVPGELIIDSVLSDQSVIHDKDFRLDSDKSTEKKPSQIFMKGYVYMLL